MEQLADRIRKARRQAGLTQSQAATALGVHRGTFGHWEQGASHLPTSAHLAQLAQALDASYEWLATGRGSMQRSSPESEISAIRLDCYAQSEEEEQLLRAFRTLPADRRKAMMALTAPLPPPPVVVMFDGRSPVRSGNHGIHLSCTAGDLAH